MLLVNNLRCFRLATMRDLQCTTFGKLSIWVAGGLWGDNPDKQRRAEGFNRAWLGHWKETQ